MNNQNPEALLQTDTTGAEPYWPYSERNGIDAESDVEVLLGQPDFHLTPEERKQVAAFAQGLFDGNVPGVEPCASSRNLEAISEASVIAAQQKFYVGFLRTPDGKERAKQFGISGDAPDEVIVGQLNDIEAMRNFDEKKRKELAAESRKWFQKQLADALTGDPADDKNWQDPAWTVVHYEPQVLIDKLYDLQAFRAFYRDVKRTVAANGSAHVQKAASTLLGIHSARINSMMADLYPHAVSLAKQLDVMPQSPLRDELEQSLVTAVPIINAARQDALFAVRMDRIRNGVAVDKGVFLPFSKELLTLAESTQSIAPTIEPQSKPEIVKEMDATEWQAGDLKVFIEDILAQWDMLSEQQITWDAADKRNGSASDNKWQVITTPKTKSLSVDGNKRTVNVPDSFKRKLSQLSPAGALPVAAHELTHVLQNEFDRKLAKQLPLARIRGRRSVTLREGGGIYQEQQFHAMLGRDRAVNFHYLRAAQAKEAGGTMLAVARAFYNSKIEGQELSEAQKAKARTTSAGSILRFYRHGSYDTQALDYSEQALLLGAMSTMSEEERARMVIAGGTFNLRDAAALHRVDLFKVPEDRMPQPAEDVMRTYLERYRHKKPAQNTTDS